LTDATAGHKTWFLVTLFDSSNNQLVKGGDTVTAVLKNALNVKTGVIDTFDNSDGTYRVEYYDIKSGTYTCEVTVNGDTGNTKTTTIKMIPDAPFAILSTISHPSVITIGSSSLIDILVKDKWANNYIEEIADIFYQVKGNHRSLYGSVPVLS